nr:CDP-diacylglycerol--serine O-phosphatidyltransferase [Syntrophobotulus glycolicus]
MNDLSKIDYTRVLPCLVTVANLLFGFLAIIFIIDSQVNLGAGMVLLSVLMDSMDGKIARKLKANSDFGKELDSLSDIVSFGLAPAVMIYVVVYQTHLPFWGLWLSAFFAICGALRLARFNVLNVSDYFIGVPITFAGGFMALLLLFAQTIPWQVFPVMMLLLSVLMISSLQVPKLGK